MQSRASFRSLAPLIISAIAVALAGLTFLIPVAAGVDRPFNAHLRTALATLTAVLFVGASVIFLQALKNFKSDLQLAYRLFAIGMILFGVSLWQLPLFGLFDLWKTVWVTSGGVLVPFVLSVAIVYAGMRRFAQLLQLHTKAASVWLVAIITATFVVLSFFAARQWTLYPGDGTDIYIAVVGWAIVLMSFSTLLAHKIARTIGLSYRHAMLWLKVALVALVVAGVHEYTTSFVVSENMAFVNAGIYLWPFAVCGFILLWSSYKFRLLEATVMAVTPAQPAPLSDNDYIDSIIAISELASRPSEIDSIMDDLRVVTTGMKPGDPLSTEQKQRLMLTFLALESYLATRDPLRSFTKTEVRSHATPAFRAIL